MKRLLIFLFVLLILRPIIGLSQDTEIPTTWTRDFVISLSYTGSMDGSATHLKFTYDSCIYINNSGMNAPKRTFFLLQESDRAEILKTMREARVDKIHSEMSMDVVNDGWSTMVCVGLHCIQGGTSTTMSDQDKNQFSFVYNYLEEYAMKKATKKYKSKK